MSRYRSRASQPPRFIVVKYDGVCAETGRHLMKGETALYYPGSKQMYADDSKQAQEWRETEFDREVLGYEC